ncbi:MAG TPA: hypothetical protein VE152_07930 [Acidimicrobiales bacterium]|nr:hypothetical protein [Acidimicrobiales bacterium]
MELTCDLSPLAYAEMYKLVRHDRDLQVRVHDRLEELGRSADWLDEIVERYELQWEWEARYDPEPVPQAEADLAAWTAGHRLRRAGSPTGRPSGPPDSLLPVLLWLQPSLQGQASSLDSAL